MLSYRHVYNEIILHATPISNLRTPHKNDNAALINVIQG